MLFNSPLFLLVFLPLTLICFFAAGRWRGSEDAIGVLLIASLIFYAAAGLFNLGLFLTSMIVNFILGALIVRFYRRRWYLATLGVVLNLSFIGFFKYSGLLVGTADHMLGTAWKVPSVALPIGISFYTFQKIAYLLDAYKDGQAESRFRRYALFVAFFPQLIAGPIVHPREVLPQFGRRNIGRFRIDDFAIGLVFLLFGLFKKTFLADGSAVFATPIFDGVYTGHLPTVFEAWGGVLAYTFQIYFDFSGYSDMAVGLARMFGIRLPFNFNSPYKAANLVDFWRCWHMTLSRFLRDYVYIPLGGNRKGKVRRYINLMLTMLIGGLWHGANWTFVVWGGLHGLGLIVNHLWRAVRGDRPPARGLTRLACKIATFGFVVIAWTFFRAVSFSGARAMFRGMVGLYGLLPTSPVPVTGWAADAVKFFAGSGAHAVETGMLIEILWLLGLLLIALTLPNTQEFILGAGRRPLARLSWRPSPAWAACLGIGFGTALTYYIAVQNHVSEFIYFRF